MLLEAGANFVYKNAEKNEFLSLFAVVKYSAPPRMSMLLPALLFTLAILLAAGTEMVSIGFSAWAAAVFMTVEAILTEQEARNAVK
jgi:2-methylisocitrate lyase-like PEP mutase family enzyme